MSRTKCVKNGTIHTFRRLKEWIISKGGKVQVDFPQAAMHGTKCVAVFYVEGIAEEILEKKFDKVESLGSLQEV